MTSINWSSGSNTSTTWTSGSVNSTDFNSRRISNLGVLMDDTVYLMDDTTATMNDDKLQSIYAPETVWA